MDGSEKQVAWAQQIQGKAVPIIERAESLVREQADGHEAEAAPVLAALEGIRGWTQARYWIDARDWLTVHADSGRAPYLLPGVDREVALIVAQALEAVQDGI